MTITSKGQVTIPKRLREKYGLDENTEVEFAEEAGAIRIIKKSDGGSVIDSIYGMLKRPDAHTDDLVRKLRGE